MGTCGKKYSDFCATRLVSGVSFAPQGPRLVIVGFLKRIFLMQIL